jgi:hypothetical protein
MDLDDILRAQQMNLDHELTNLRRFYDTLTPTERQEFRQWLDAIRALEEASPWEGSLVVHLSCNEEDAEGNIVPTGGCARFAGTMLAAIDCWDKGEPFVPVDGWPY